MFARHALAGILMVAAAPCARAQGIGSYLNFETPVLKPMAVATVGADLYLLVCNTPDAAVEIYATSDLHFVARVPVGAEPVSIAVKPTALPSGGARCYAVNWLGDSITLFDLELNLSGNLVPRVVRTVRVGDEPMMIAFMPSDESLLVTFSAQQSWGWFDPETLQPMAPGLGRRELLSPDGSLGVKDPRAVAFCPATAEDPNVPGRLFIANFRGGNDGSSIYDLDLWCADDAALAVQSEHATALESRIGTANANLAFAPNGDLYVASLHARNDDTGIGSDPITALGEPFFRAMVRNGTGFVTSQLVRLRGAGSGASEKVIIDLNLDHGAQSTTPVTQPTDVLVYGSGHDGETRVFVTGFSSDTLAVVVPHDGVFDVLRVDVSAPGGFSRINLAGVMRGPRAFALKASGVPNDAADRVYVLNRLENSVTVLDPNFSDADPQSAVLTSFALQHDPTPAMVRDGRKFLYSSKLSAGGNVSCASCHLDGHSDFLAWNLSDGNPVPPKGQGLPGALGPNPGVKGPMVTQSLRGLVNYEVEDKADQDTFFSNRPYHWRGDKGLFTDFNAAFVNLMDIDDPFSIDANDPGLNKGITDAAMVSFRLAVDSIHYPPNAEEPLERRYGGEMGDTKDELANASFGSGTLRGLKVFHIGSPSMGTLTCVACHTLPVGTNRLFGGTFFYLGTPLAAQSIEAAQLRGGVIKEKKLMRTDASGNVVPLPEGSPGAVTGEFGLVHTGKTTLIFKQTDSSALPFLSDSLYDFIFGFGIGAEQSSDVARYMREFDTGIAPIVGQSLTADFASMTADPPSIESSLDLMEGQVALANAGLAVHASMAGVERGFVFDLRDPAHPYVEEAHGGVLTIGPLARSELLAYVDPSAAEGAPENLLVFHATPLGSEYRVAYRDGGLPPSPIVGAPSNIQLLGCRPNTANVDIPKLTKNWIEALISGHFNLLTNNKTVIWYQASLFFHAKTSTPPMFGMTGLRHDTPRRLRVRGDGIEPGAWLKLYGPRSSDINTATSTTPPTTTPTDATHTIAFELPLHPARDEHGDLVWETAEELDSLFIYSMLNGGPNNFITQLAIDQANHPGFLQVVNFDLFQPLKWNWWYVQVRNDRNDPSTFASGGWQRVFIE